MFLSEHNHYLTAACEAFQKHKGTLFGTNIIFHNWNPVSFQYNKWAVEVEKEQIGQASMGTCFLLFPRYVAQSVFTVMIMMIVWSRPHLSVCLSVCWPVCLPVCLYNWFNQLRPSFMRMERIIMQLWWGTEHYRSVVMRAGGKRKTCGWACDIALLQLTSDLNVNVGFIHQILVENNNM